MRLESWSWKLWSCLMMALAVPFDLSALSLWPVSCL